MTDPIADFMNEVDSALGQQEESPPAESVPAAEEPPAAEAPAAEAEPPSQEEPSGEMLLGKFKSTEDLAKSYEALESKLDEQGAELGELRRLRQELDEQRQQLQYQQQQPSVPLNQETVDWFDEQVLENPLQAAEWARTNDGSGVLLNRALDTWYEVNPRQAAQYERQFEMAALAHFMQSQVGSEIQPLTEQARRAEFADAWKDAAQTLPDLNDNAEAILEVASNAPEILSMLEHGDRETKQRVIQNLYYLAKGRQAASAVSAAHEAAAAQAAQTQSVRQEASFVAPPTGAGQPETRTAAERWLEEVFDPAAAQYYGSSSST